MNCAWQEYLSIIPLRFRGDVNRIGETTLLETRLRINEQPKLITTAGEYILQDKVTLQDLQYTINVASEYSPWSAVTISSGFITALGGHRIGICGSAVMVGENMTSIRCVHSLSIRVCRSFRGISSGLERIDDSILIIGSPGTGKTTLLRDLICQKSLLNTGSIAVVDEREEVFPFLKDIPIFNPGNNTDILSGCPKRLGISYLIRNMGPSLIALDEITHPEDCAALLQAAWCGVKIIATAHAGSLEEFQSRIVYRPILENRVFQYFVVMNKDKTWRVERIQQ